LITNIHKKAIVVFYTITITLVIILIWFYFEKPYNILNIIGKESMNLTSSLINLTIIFGWIFLILFGWSFYDKRKYPKDYIKSSIVFPNTISNSENISYFYGFDYLRIILCIFVVAMHTGIIGWGAHINPNSGITVITMTDIIFMNIFMVALPLFLFISLFLYIQNSKIKVGYFKNRIIYLGSIYIFWYFIYMSMTENGITFSKIFDIRYLFSGGDLVMGIGYFIFDLLILLIIIESLLYIKQKITDRGFFILNLVIISITLLPFIIIPLFADFSYPIDRIFIVGGASLLNYLSYPSIILLISYYYEKDKFNGLSSKMYALLSILIIFCAAIEWSVLPYKIIYDGSIMSHYGRFSIVLTAILLFIFALQVTKKSSVIINWFAGLTMGIYILHIPVSKILEGSFKELYVISSYTSIGYFIILIVITTIITHLVKKVGVV